MIHVVAIPHLLTYWLNERQSRSMQFPTSTHHPLASAVLASLNYNVCAPAVENIIGYCPIGGRKKKLREKIVRSHIRYIISFFVRILRPIIINRYDMCPVGPLYTYKTIDKHTRIDADCWLLWIVVWVCSLCFWFVLCAGHIPILPTCPSKPMYKFHIL